MSSKTTTSEPYPGTQSVVRAISLLKAFSETHPEWGLTDLAQRVDLNKTTVYRLLTALESEGMVVQNPATQSYRLGPEMIALGTLALRSSDLRSASHPALEVLARETGETATLEILMDDQVFILDEVMGRHLIGATPSIGTRWPAHATSTGKVYADQPLRDVVSALRDAFFQDVEGKVTEQGHRSVLVYDRAERFVGMLRVRDVIAAVIPPYLLSSPYSSYFTGMFLAQAKVMGNRGVGDLLDDSPSIDERCSLMEAVHEMTERRTINLPVTRDGELVGILRDKDLLLEIAANM